MADCAAYLVDHVLPRAPYRQWTLSLPHDIRLLVIRNPDLLSRVVQLFLRAIFAPLVIEKILTHLGLPTSLPPVAPSRAPPEDELELCFAQTFPDAEPDWPA